MKYEIIEAGDRNELSRIINKNEVHGWTISGGVASSDGKFFQVITHKSDGDPKPIYTDSEEIEGLEACGVCGEISCDNALHADLEEMASLMKGLRDIKKK